MIHHSIFTQSLVIRLTSADPHSALQRMTAMGIEVREVVLTDPLHIRFIIPEKHYGPLRLLCQKRGDELEILRRQGPRQTLGSLRKRPVLTVGILVLCLLSLCLPTRVLFLRVEGNVSVPTGLILEQAAASGVHFGTACRQIRSDAVKNALLARIPQLEWVGVNTYGCVAVITVREGKTPQHTPDSPELHSIVALRDAIVGEMTVLQGNPQCRPGDAVLEGQVLVSPYTDCGICIRVTDTKAEIYGQTQRQLSLLCPTEYRKKAQIIGRDKKYSLIIGKKRINFYKGSGISDSTCAKIYEENYLTLPGGFVLPIAVICEEYLHYRPVTEQHSVGEEALAQLAAEYLAGRMLAGRIQQADHLLTNGSGSCRLDSVFTCYELISISRPEEGITDHE